MCHTTCHLWTLQQQLQLLLPTPNSVQVGVVHTIFEVALKYEQGFMYSEYGSQDHSHLKRTGNWSTGHDHQTHHPGRPRDTHCMGVHHPAEKCYVHMPFSLNDQNDLTLQMLQVQLAVNSNFCTRWLTADHAGACFMLNFLCFDNKHPFLHAVHQWYPRFAFH